MSVPALFSHRMILSSTLFVLLAIAAPLSTFADEPPPFSPPFGFWAPGHFAHHDGATLYHAICQGCHMPDGKGAVGAGYYPALAGNPKLASATYPALTVLQGRHGMPPFHAYLGDDQVAEVVNYVRTHFGNNYSDALTPADVAKLR
ncbi:MAG: cytochrome c [Dokdonella sp.]